MEYIKYDMKDKIKQGTKIQRQLVKRQEQKQSNNDMIRESYKKINLEFAEYKAALEAVKIEIITAGE